MCLVASCTKNQELNTTADQVLSQKTATADVTYHYKGQAYPLYFVEGSTEDFVKEENYSALEAATAQSEIVTFTYNNEAVNNFYLFDNEFEGYDYMEKNHDNPLIGRKFKVSLRVDELRESLMAQFGPSLDYKNAAVAQAAQLGIQAIYDELHINLPFPDDVAAFIGVTNSTFTRQKSGVPTKTDPVLTVWVDANYTGEEMHVEQAPNTVIWNYGPNDCFTMAANPDLTLEFQTNGNNWNDCISSKCLTYIQGADAIGEGYYKDSHFGVYSCGQIVQITEPHTINAWPGACFNFNDVTYGRGPACGHANDQISSIRIKAVWQGCYTGDNTFNDLLNL